MSRRSQPVDHTSDLDQPQARDEGRAPSELTDDQRKRERIRVLAEALANIVRRKTAEAQPDHKENRQ